MKNYKNEALESIIDALEAGYDGYLCDLHSEVFNEDCWKIYTNDAIEALENYINGTFGAIGEIVEYEQFNFGEINTDFTNPVNIANMLWYIIGQEVMSEYEILNDDEYWNNLVDEEFRIRAITELKQYLINEVA